jgi:hypothetical protein
MSIKSEYKNMPTEFCWNCGRTAHDWPEWFGAPWIMQRHHIVNKPRLEDRRCVIVLCHLCHFGAWHGERYPQWIRPRLTLAHALWIKRAVDPQYYDRQILQRCSVRILPRAAKPPAIFLREYASRRVGFSLTA